MIISIDNADTGTEGARSPRSGVLLDRFRFHVVR